MKGKFQALFACASVMAIATAAAAQNAPRTAVDTVATGTVAELVVTAQRRSESLQSVPIAVSAFTQDSLKAQRIDGAANLQLSVPNLNFTPGGYGAPNFQIRGIGYTLVTAAGDSGVSIHQNYAPLDKSRIAESDFYDVERVEVLRGPQGTLYGRNASGGVINVITAKPNTQGFAGELTGEYGNYNTGKLRGFVNLPLGTMFSLRLAGDWYKRDGYQLNLGTGNKIADRDLYSTRTTLGFEPNDRFKAYLMWEHFQAYDHPGGGKTLCDPDPGPTSVGGVPVTNPQAQTYLSTGCRQTDINSAAAQTGVVNTGGVLGGKLLNLLGIASGNLNAGQSQPNDPRQVRLDKDPFRKVRNDNYQFTGEYRVTDDLTLSSITQYEEDHVRDGAGGIPGTVPFRSTALTPGGVFNDPQIGPSNVLTSNTYDDLSTKQWSEELRLASSFSGPLNFSLGGLYLHIHRYDNVFIPSNATTIFVKATVPTAFVDPNYPPDSSGHNYYNAVSPYTLTSTAVFGEVYYQLSDDVRLTGGLRYTSDDKTQRYVPLAFLSPGKGLDPTVQFDEKAKFGETTGRFNIDWSPKLDFTDRTLVYASYSRGYKGGGFNTPDLTTQQATTYQPEFVDAFEIGTKNTLFDHTLTLNLTGFFYLYNGFQYSVSQGLSVGTANVDAHIGGVELESVWSPVRNVAFNLNVGYLKTSIQNGQFSHSIDTDDVTAGTPGLIVLETSSSRCVGQASQVATVVRLINSGALPASTLLGLCPTAAAPNGPLASSLGVVTSPGVEKNVAGNALSNSPEWNVSFGAQYRWDVGDWAITPRVDVHYQSSAFADIYNNPWKVIPEWWNVNSTVTFDNDRLNLSAQLYVKNLFDDTNLVAGASAGPSLGNAFLASYNEPRMYGISLTKRF